MVNETFAEMMRWGDDVVGRTVYTEGNTFKVVGQLKDFQIESFRTEKMPFIARGNKNFYGTVHVRLRDTFPEKLQKLNRDVAEAFHDQTIDFTGYEKRIENSYNSVRVFRNATLMAAVTMFFIMLMGLMVVGCGTFALCVLEPQHSFVQLLFEQISAYSTAGLTMGINPSLHAASKVVLIATMFIGRVGAFTLLSLWVSRPEPSAKYTEEAITIG